MPRDITITITDEQDAAAAIQSTDPKNPITVEDVIDASLDDLVSTADGLHKQEVDAKFKSLSPSDQKTIESLRKQQDAQLEAAIDAAIGAKP